jgi:hypothetical protein
LYNKGLEGAANYMAKYQSTMQEMYEALNEMHLNWINGEYESWEEY